MSLSYPYVEEVSERMRGECEVGQPHRDSGIRMKCGAWRLLLLLLLLVVVARPANVRGETEYAEGRKGEFLAAQYQRAVALESEALQLAAVRRYSEANDSLALSVRIHEQLLGHRHPQLLKPLFVAAENAAVWGSHLGMEGRPQVLHAMDLLNRGLQILTTTPHPTREQMEEEAIRITNLLEVLEQMLAAISPPKGLTSSPNASTAITHLPQSFQTISPGELIAGSLHRGKEWAFFVAPVAESWIHAQAQPEWQGQVMVYGIQTITTVSLMTHDSKVKIHALLSTADSALPTEVGTIKETGQKACEWWTEPGCLDSLTVDDFVHSGGHGVGVGLPPSSPQNDAPMRFHFTDLPAEEGNLALLAAHLGSAAPGITYTFMLQVHAEPLIPLHLEESVQNWEVDGFRASIHYFTLAKGSELHSLEVRDLKCVIPSQVRLLFGWGDVPNTGTASLRQARRCVVSDGHGISRLPPGGCWWEGAPSVESATGEAGPENTLYVVVLNPCPDPTAYTVEAKWGHDGGDRPPSLGPRVHSRKISETDQEENGKSEADLCNAGEHCHVLGGIELGAEKKQHAVKRITRQPMQSSFIPASRPAEMRSAMHQPLPWYVQVLLVFGVLTLASGGLYLVARGRLGKVRNLGPPSQRRRPRPGSAAHASARGSIFRFPTLAELSGALPRRDDRQETEYELQLRRGRVTVSEVKRTPPNRVADDAVVHPTVASVSTASDDHRSAAASLTRGTLRSRQSPVSSGNANAAADGASYTATSGSGMPNEVVSKREQVESAVADLQTRDKLPDMYICPITQELMRDPVFASDGYTYERAAISKWIRKRRTSPMTNLPITNDLVPNLALRSAIRETLELSRP